MKKDIGTESTRTAYINGIILTGEKDMTPIKRHDPLHRRR